MDLTKYPQFTEQLHQIRGRTRSRTICPGSAVKTMATVRKLLTPSRSPVEIASKLAGERSGLRLRDVPVADGMPVAN